MVFLMSRIKFSTHIHPLKLNNKSIEIKHDICSRLNIMFKNYMVSTKFTYALFQRKRHSRAVHRCSIKKLFRKISQTSLERMVIGFLLSTCRNTDCNFIENDSPIQVLRCEFYEISQNNFTQNNCLGLLQDVKRSC